MRLWDLFHVNETTNVFFMIFRDFLLTKYHKFVSSVSWKITHKIGLHVYISLRTGVAFLGYSFMLRSPNQRANQIRRSYKNEEFDWLFDFVTVTWKNNPFLGKKMSPNQNAHTTLFTCEKNRTTNQNTHTTNFTCEKYSMQWNMNFISAEYYT